MNKENRKIIKDITENILKMIGFDCNVAIIEDEEDESRVICNIETKKDASFLIGQSGDSLQALQHLSRLLVRKETDDMIKFVLDVNSYKKEQESSILDLARESAKQSVDEKRMIVMKPMSAYNRRLVHMFLANSQDVITESVGEEEDRRVIIKPRFLL